MIPLVAPCITDADRTAVAAAAYHDGLTSDRLLRDYEEAFAGRVGCAGAVAVCSGTTALALAIRAYGITPRKDVSVGTLTCSATANAVMDAGGIPYPLDGDFDVRTAKGSMRLPYAPPTVELRTLAVTTHLFGRRTTTNFLYTVEDWTLSLGNDGAFLGNVGVCSTHASKMLSTGRGGIVFSNDSALLAEVRATAYYDSTPNGTLGAHSLGMTSMQAALGLSQLRQLDGFIARRREIAAYYSARFEPAGIECPDPECGSVFFRYLIAVQDPAAKVAALAEHGIEAGRGVYPPLHRQLGLPDEDFPGATDCVNRLLSVPCHPSLTDAQVAYVAEKVLEVCA